LNKKMWSPTHVQVLVKRAKGLNVKGKNGTNDAFVTIGLGKEKFQTSAQERTEDPEWCEQCELSIPEQGNRAEVVLKVLHRNFMGGDDFLGQVSLPLQDFDVYEKPKAGWYPLECKPGQKKTDYRGDLEVKIGFTVRASESVGGSVADLTKKNKGSISSLNKVAGNIGGSLLSLGGKEKKNFKKIAASVTKKVEKVGGKAKKSVSSLKLNKDKGGLDSLPETQQWNRVMLDNAGASFPNEDPGVNSDDEDDMFQGSMESLSIPPVKQGKQTAASGGLGDWEDKLLGYKTGVHAAPAHDDALSMTSILSTASQVTTLDTWTPYRQEDKEIWTSHNKQEDRENENAFTTNTRQDDKEYIEQNSELMSSLPSYNEVRGR